MKTIATLIATLVATAAFATEPAKTPAVPASAPVAATAVTAPAKCVAAKDKHCKIEPKAEVKPVKSQAPVVPAATKASEPAKK